MKILPFGAEFFHVGAGGVGKTDARRGRHDEANSSFARFRERAQKIHQIAALSITTARRTVQVLKYNPSEKR